MRAVRCERYGDPEVLEVRDLPDPVAGPGEVVVGIEAAAVNFPDVLMVADKYQLSIPVPFTPGAEFAGRVLEIGEGVASFAPGAPVVGSSFLDRSPIASRCPRPCSRHSPPGWIWRAPPPSGSRTEPRTTRWSPRPRCNPENGWSCSARRAVWVRRRRYRDETRWPRHRGRSDARPARGRHRTRRRRRLAYGSEDLKQRIKDITGSGVNVIIVPVGGVYAEQAIRAGAWGSRYVTVGFADGAIPRIPMNLLLLKGVTLKGFDMRMLPERHPAEMAAGEQALAELIAGGMRPHV